MEETLRRELLDKTKHDRLDPPDPSRRYTAEDAVDQPSLQCLMDIEGVTGFAWTTRDKDFHVFYDPALIAPAQLDEKVIATGLAACPLD